MKINADDSQNLTNIIEDIISLAMKKPGVTAVEAGTSVDNGISVTVRNREIETVEFNKDKSIGITVYNGQAKATVSTTDVSQQAVADAIEHACQIANYTQADECSGLATKALMAKDLKDLELYYLANIEPDSMVEVAKACEAAALDYSDKIHHSDGASVAAHTRYRVYGNSNGFIGGYPSSRYSISCMMIAKNKRGMQRDYDYTADRNYTKLDSPELIGARAAKRAVARLDAKKLKTMKAPVIFMADVAKGLLGGFVTAISGGSLYRSSSFLLDSMGKKVFPEFVNIDERPHLLGYLGSAPYDNDGLETCAKHFIKQGIIENYILGTYAGRKLGLPSTANSGGVHNLHAIADNAVSFDDMLKSMNTGLIVTEVMGHGTNIVTGDYSQGAAGFWVENGEIQYPVEEVTVAGNLKDIYANLKCISDDYDKRGNLITGSWLIDEMTIAGS